jgi:hypothetical protein
MWVKLSNNMVASCSFPTIDPKLGVELPNFIESNKSTLEQEVEGFHMACGGYKRQIRVAQPCRNEISLLNGESWSPCSGRRCHIHSSEYDNSMSFLS